MVTAPTTTTTHQLGELTVWCVWVPGSIGPKEVHVIGPNGSGVTTSHLKGLRLGELAPEPDPVPEDLRVDLEALGEALGRSAPGRGGGGRGTRMSARHLASVALFIALAKERKISDPCYHMADLAKVHRNTVQQWMDRARETGYLTRSTKGRNGGLLHGHMTDKAVEALRVR